MDSRYKLITYAEKGVYEMEAFEGSLLEWIRDYVWCGRTIVNVQPIHTKEEFLAIAEELRKLTEQSLDG